MFSVNTEFYFCLFDLDAFFLPFIALAKISSRMLNETGEIRYPLLLLIVGKKQSFTIMCDASCKFLIYTLY